MNKSKANEILAEKIEELKKLSYEHFRKWVLEKHIEVLEVQGATGAKYTIEMEAHWDSPKKPEEIRVFASIDDGHWPAVFCPLSKDFIIAPDGSLIG